MIRGCILAGLIVAFPAVVNAQAFGVNAGDPVSKYGGKATGNGNQFEINVPHPNSEFAIYVAYATPSTGICAVAGLGKTHESDGYGFEIRSAFSRLHSALSAKYGPSRDFDFLHAGSIWSEAKEFGWSLYKKERSLSSYWDDEENSTNLGVIEGITLSAKAIAPDKTYINLRYEFRNYDACSAVRAERDNAGL